MGRSRGPPLFTVGRSRGPPPSTARPLSRGPSGAAWMARTDTWSFAVSLAVVNERDSRGARCGPVHLPGCHVLPAGPVRAARSALYATTGARAVDGPATARSTAGRVRLAALAECTTSPFAECVSRAAPADTTVRRACVSPPGRHWRTCLLALTRRSGRTTEGVAWGGHVQAGRVLGKRRETSGNGLCGVDSGAGESRYAAAESMVGSTSTSPASVCGNLWRRRWHDCRPRSFATFAERRAARPRACFAGIAAGTRNPWRSSHVHEWRSACCHLGVSGMSGTVRSQAMRHGNAHVPLKNAGRYQCPRSLYAPRCHEHSSLPV